MVIIMRRIMWIYFPSLVLLMYAYATDGAHDLVAPVHRDLVNQEKLDVDSMGYPKLPAAMLGGESVILNLLTIFIFPVPLTTNLIFSSWHVSG